jgi:hypothetical protein
MSYYCILSLAKDGLVGKSIIRWRISAGFLIFLKHLQFVIWITTSHCFQGYEQEMMYAKKCLKMCLVETILTAPAGYIRLFGKSPKSIGNLVGKAYRAMEIFLEML